MKISVIVPAHNESSLIASGLTRLLPLLDAVESEIIVGCNGCSDDTAERARSVSSRICVLETEQRGKYNGLNLADCRATGAYRIYLDADILVGTQDLLHLVEVMERDGLLAASPRFEIDCAKSSWAVKAFYRVWTHLPYFTNGEMIGSGLFALSPAGRQRFAEFPAIIADDGYVRQLFTTGERRTIDDCKFTVRAPRDLQSLIKIKTRARLGNMELKAKYPGAKVGGENKGSHIWRIAMSDSSAIFAMPIYLLVQLRTRQRALQQFKKSQFKKWERDESARIGNRSLN